MSFRRLATALAATALASVAITAQTLADPPQIITTFRYAIRTDAAHPLRLPPSLAVIDGSVEVVDGEIALGAPFVRFAVRHRHSGRLTQDLLASGLPYGRTKVLAPAGSYVFQWVFNTFERTRVREHPFQVRMGRDDEATLMCGVSDKIDFFAWHDTGFCVVRMTPVHNLTQTTYVMDSVGRDERYGLGLPSASFPDSLDEGAKQRSAFVWRETGEPPPRPLSVEASIRAWRADRLEVVVVGVDGLRRSQLAVFELRPSTTGEYSIPFEGQSIELIKSTEGYRTRKNGPEPQG